MKTKDLFIIFFLSTILPVACETEKSSDVNQNRIYARYTLTYEGKSDETIARARFRFGNRYGTHLELEKPSTITLNNEELEFKSLLSYYEQSFKGKILEGTFNWTTFEELELINTVTLNEIAFPTDLSEISSDSSYVLHWVGKAIEENEYVKLSLNGNFEDDASTQSISKVGSTSITISKDKLQNLPINEEANFTFEYGHTPNLAQETSAGGIIIGRYRVSKKIMIR